MLQTGKFVILLMVSIAMALSAFAWWYQYHRNPRVKSVWGTPGVLAIQYSPHVEFIQLSQDSADVADAIQIGEAEYRGVVADISGSPGLVHVRHALLSDNTYEWKQSLEKVSQWDFALRFSGNDHQEMTIAFTNDCQSMIWIEGGQTLPLTPASAAAFRKKRDDWQRLRPAGNRSPVPAF